VDISGTTKARRNTIAHVQIVRPVSKSNSEGDIDMTKAKYKEQELPFMIHDGRFTSDSDEEGFRIFNTERFLNTVRNRVARFTENYQEPSHVVIWSGYLELLKELQPDILENDKIIGIPVITVDYEYLNNI
jgi:hypothetical protein